MVTFYSRLKKTLTFKLHKLIEIARTIQRFRHRENIHLRDTWTHSQFILITRARNPLSGFLPGELWTPSSWQDFVPPRRPAGGLLSDVGFVGHASYITLYLCGTSLALRPLRGGFASRLPRSPYTSFRLYVSGSALLADVRQQPATLRFSLERRPVPRPSHLRPPSIPLTF